MQQGNTDLSRLRTRIDAIDDQMLQLLFQRADIVREVGALKARNTTPGLSFIRPAREASMLRTLSHKAGKEFPPAAIALMWRMIISASLVLERPMQILACVSEQDASPYWMAREYFGVVMPVMQDSSAQSVIARVAEDGAVVGVLPLLDAPDSPWWLRPREEKNHVYVFAQLPFIRAAWMTESPALVIANVMPEPSDDDWSVIAVETPASEAVLRAALLRDVSDLTVLARAPRGMLIATKGFLAPHSSFSAWESALPEGSRIRLLGAFATPMEAA